MRLVLMEVSLHDFLLNSGNVGDYLLALLWTVEVYRSYSSMTQVDAPRDQTVEPRSGSNRGGSESTIEDTIEHRRRTTDDAIVDVIES